MAEHVADWLGAYLDAELDEPQMRRVRDHLLVCAACRAEFGRFQALSQLLQEETSPKSFMPVERFVSRVSLSLPPRAGVAAVEKTGVRLALAAPLAVLAVWVAWQATMSARVLVSATNSLGLLGTGSTWISNGPQHSLWYSVALGLFGSNLSGTRFALLNLLDNVSLINWNWTSQLAWQAWVGLLYWSGLVLWWVRGGYTATGSSFRERAAPPPSDMGFEQDGAWRYRKENSR